MRNASAIALTTLLALAHVACSKKVENTSSPAKTHPGAVTLQGGGGAPVGTGNPAPIGTLTDDVNPTDAQSQNSDPSSSEKTSIQISLPNGAIGRVSGYQFWEQGKVSFEGGIATVSKVDDPGILEEVLQSAHGGPLQGFVVIAGKSNREQVETARAGIYPSQIVRQGEAILNVLTSGTVDPRGKCVGECRFRNLYAQFQVMSESLDAKGTETREYLIGLLSTFESDRLISLKDADRSSVLPVIENQNWIDAFGANIRFKKIENAMRGNTQHSERVQFKSGIVTKTIH